VQYLVYGITLAVRWLRIFLLKKMLS